MKTISLTNGMTVLIDDEDFDEVSKFNWSAHRPSKNNNYYAKRKNKERKDVLLHRSILGLTDRSQLVDHINHNTLDNRRCNLRICNYKENSRNKRKCIQPRTSKYRGVCWYKRHSTWQVQIRINDKVTHVGYFKDEIEAAKAYDSKAREHYGEFANPNFK